MDIKDLIIFLTIFIIVLWLQHNDDNKFKKHNRISLYDKIKLPLFASCVCLLLKNLNKCYVDFRSIFILPLIQKEYSNDLFNDIFTEPPDF